MSNLNLYEKLKAAGCELDNHESDLYVLATEEAHQIIREHEGVERMFRDRKGQFQTTRAVEPIPFKGVDGRVWFEITAAYMPFWDAVTERSRKAKS